MTVLANLFDTGMVFAVALLTALVSLYGIRITDGQVTPPSGSTGLDERVDLRRVPLRRFRESTEDLDGEGERLGTAYRLSTGEVVYVPDE